MTTRMLGAALVIGYGALAIATLLLLIGCSLPIAAANPYRGGSLEYDCWHQAWNASEAAQRYHAALVDAKTFDACVREGAGR